MDIINRCIRKAKKFYKCDLCGELIAPKQSHYYAFVKDRGKTKSIRWHKHCNLIAAQSPSFHMLTEEDFSNLCKSLCKEYVCPKCKCYNVETEKCHIHADYCIDKLYEFFRSHLIILVDNKLKCVERGEKIEEPFEIINII